MIRSLLLSCLIIISLLINPLFSSGKDNHSLISMKNTNNKLMTYLVFWIDHPYPQIKEPINVAGGELKPGEKNTLNYVYKNGHYYILWYDKYGKFSNSITFKMTDEIREVFLTDKEVKYLK